MTIDMQQSIQTLSASIQKEISAYISKNSVGTLYQPNAYILGLGGKRMRPLMLMLGVQAFSHKEDFVAKAIPASVAIELFHNFTLMHDDIMDNAPLRRGKVTVHEKWDTNTAILSGDALLVQAYEYLAKVDPAYFSSIFSLFNTTALEVCEGQQLDMEFETRNDVVVEEYIEMIRLKTSVLLAAAVKMGAILGGATAAQADALYKYGEYTGLAFQLRDDYLDAFGDTAKFGKQPGGDILADKKTFLQLELKAKTTLEDYTRLAQIKDPKLKVAETLECYMAQGVDKAALAAIASYAHKAAQCLADLEQEGLDVSSFRAISALLLERES